MATDNKNKQSQTSQEKTKNENPTSSGAMTPQEAGHLGGTAPRRHGMSREEAGHLGGTAHHTCRGFECQEEHKKSKK
jgi:hypothetical protein